MKRISRNRKLKELSTQTRLQEESLAQVKAGSGSIAIARGNNSRANAGGGAINKKIHIGN
ncbi:MAG: hypothetical protein KC777_24105 [Cyanobacteria bacterium HKST-UBA02]|nr:hypothetical protein [Cyanobacteria bacterium HKST-UBA02]